MGTGNKGVAGRMERGLPSCCSLAATPFLQASVSPTVKYRQPLPRHCTVMVRMRLCTSECQNSQVKAWPGVRPQWAPLEGPGQTALPPLAIVEIIPARPTRTPRTCTPVSLLFLSSETKYQLVAALSAATQRAGHPEGRSPKRATQKGECFSWFAVVGFSLTSLP